MVDLWEQQSNIKIDLKMQENVFLEFKNFPEGMPQDPPRKEGLPKEYLPVMLNYPQFQNLLKPLHTASS